MKRKLSKILGIALTVAMLASLLVAAAPAAALSQPQVSISPVTATIGANSTYTITYNAGTALAGGNQTVIVFPAGTNITGITAANVTIEALAGIGGGPIAAGSNPATVAITGTYPAAQTMTITLNGTQSFGAGSLVGIKIAGVINAQTPGSYTLTVATQTAGNIPVEAAVTSASFTISSPALTALPGVVKAYNVAEILVAQRSSITTAIADAGVGGRIEVGPGTYDENVVCNVAEQTIIATGEAGTVIIRDENGDGSGGTIDIQAAGNAATKKGVTVEGFVVSANAFATPVADRIKISTAATYATVKNCTITAGTASGINISTGTNHAVTDCTIDATSTIFTPTGIIAGGQVTISNTTINVGKVGGVNGKAVTSSVGTALLPTTIKNCEINGSSGIGVDASSGNLSISDTVFTKLVSALVLGVTAPSNPVVTVQNSTISECGGTATALADAVEIAGTANVKMNANTIKDTEENNYAIGMIGGTLVANFNNILNNAKNINDTTGTADAVNNWWGTSDGPVTTSIIGATYKPFLTNASSESAAVFGLAELKTKDTIGVDVASYGVTGAPAATTSLTVAKYEDNPEMTAPTILGTGSVLGYYDVYVTGTAGVSSIVVKLYGDVTQYTKVYYAGGLAGTWSAPNDWGYNVAGGYVYINITNVAGSSPNFVDLAGLPFALVEDKTLSKPDLTTAAGGSPALGAYDISTNPTFTWGAVVGADHYELVVSEDPSFTIVVFEDTPDTPFYKAVEDLDYDTTYYWRVRGVLDTASTAFTPWATGIFTTETESASTGTTGTVTPVEVTTTPAEVQIVQVPGDGESTPIIPTYLLWVIVVVGVVLVVALIVLIVRTRRVA